MYGTISAEVIRSAAWASRPRPWVARLTGLDRQFGLVREFVKGVWDYTYARGKRGGRGIYIYWSLAPGLYEIFRPVSWRHEERFFFRVDDGGEIQTITHDEVLECLKNATSV